MAGNYENNFFYNLRDPHQKNQHFFSKQKQKQRFKKKKTKKTFFKKIFFCQKPKFFSKKHKFLVVKNRVFLKKIFFFEISVNLWETDKMKKIL